MVFKIKWREDSDFLSSIVSNCTKWLVNITHSHSRKDWTKSGLKSSIETIHFYISIFSIQHSSIFSIQNPWDTSSQGFKEPCPCGFPGWHPNGHSLELTFHLICSCLFLMSLPFWCLHCSFSFIFTAPYIALLRVVCTDSDPVIHWISMKTFLLILYLSFSDSHPLEFCMSTRLPSSGWWQGLLLSKLCLGPRESKLWQPEFCATLFLWKKAGIIYFFNLYGKFLS